MGSTLAIVLGAILLGAVQLAAGVWVGRRLPFGRRGSERSGVASRELQTWTRRLHGLVTRVADEVGEHQSRIEQVSRELNSMQVDNEAPVTEVFLATVAQAMKINEHLQSRLSAAEEKLQYQARQIESHMSEARTDALTGLPNRRAFDDELGRRIAEWHRRGTMFCLLMIDVDHFKDVNDRYGHPAGDELLRELAAVLRITFREMDMVTRFGGEEIAVILPSTRIEDGKRAAERIRTAVAAFEFLVDQTVLHVTVSLGLAGVEDGDDCTSLVQRADEALYASKRAGRNCAHVHTEEGSRRIVLPSPAGDDRSNRHANPDEDDDPALKVACDDLRCRLVEVIDEDEELV